MNKYSLFDAKCAAQVHEAFQGIVTVVINTITHTNVK